MPLLARQASRLLKTVGGKPHAGSIDHEESVEESSCVSNGLSREEEDELFAEPQSSDDEPSTSPPSTLQPSNPKPQPRGNIQVANGAVGSRRPPKKSSRKRGAIRAPTSGTYARGQADRAERGSGEDKENAISSQPSGGSQQVNPWGFDDMELGQPAAKKKKQKTMFDLKNRSTTLNNIHSKPASTQTSRGGSQGYGKSAQRKYRKAALDEQEGEARDVPLLKDDEFDEILWPDGKKAPDPDLRTREAKRKPIQQVGDNLKQPFLGEKELDECLESGAEEIQPTRSSPRSRPVQLRGPLGEWIEAQTLGSSQPESSASREALDNIDDYIDKLPEEEEEGSICPICKAQVEREDYWKFWTGKDRTVKNQNAFCRDHKTKSAWDEYRSEGYPDIDWSALPQRIKNHRMKLFGILNNDRPSAYRDRYEPIALTGKAAAVPSRRKDLPEHVQQELESYALDDQSTYPGYYGPHGRRVITEHVMKMLKNEIKNCSDAVVQGSGPATFVQAVLVPEAAILLIMEDCRVDWEEAEEIRERTYDMGMLLNEEIEDEVVAHDQSDDENEYGGI